SQVPADHDLSTSQTFCYLSNQLWHGSQRGAPDHDDVIANSNRCETIARTLRDQRDPVTTIAPEHPVRRPAVSLRVRQRQPASGALPSEVAPLQTPGRTLEVTQRNRQSGEPLEAARAPRERESSFRAPVDAQAQFRRMLSRQSEPVPDARSGLFCPRDTAV